jgi:hypothetical protein
MADQVEKIRQRGAPLLGRERVEIGDLGFAENMQPVGCKAASVSRQGQPWSGNLGCGHGAIQPQVARERLELKRVSPARKEIAEPEHQSGLLG